MMARRIVAALAAAFVLVGGLAAPADAAVGTAGERARASLADQMDDAGAPGAAFVVVDTDGATIAGGLGATGDGREVTAHTPFVIGSTSKSITALAAMQLLDAGLVDLDAAVRSFVPELRLAEEAAADTITVRHVLQQTSGLPGTAGGPVLKAAMDGTPLDAVAELRGTHLVGAPGQVWHYSNTNYVLAGLVVERASGMSYAEYVERRIFAPLGMTGSSAHLRDARSDGVAPGHRRWFGATVTSGPALRSGLLAAGFLVSTAQDLGRYLQMYLRGGLAEDGTRVVSPEGLRTMTAPGPPAQLGTWAGGATVRYAMGWFTPGPWPEPALLHPGNSPDTSAMITVLPERGMAVATLLNLSHELPVPGNPAVPDRLSPNVVDAVLGEPVDSGPSTTTFYLWFDLG
jgi:CubicO group peptidase (beta-lactamase class C family)